MATTADSSVLPDVRDALVGNVVGLEGDNGDAQTKMSDDNAPDLDGDSGDLQDQRNDNSADVSDEGYEGGDHDLNDKQSLEVIGEEEVGEFNDEGYDDDDDGGDVAGSPLGTSDGDELRKQEEDLLDYKIDHYRKKKVEQLREKAKQARLSDWEVAEYEGCGGGESSLT